MKQKNADGVEDHDAAFSPVPAASGFRTILSLATQLEMFADHVNISQAFVQGELLPGDRHNGNVYISAPPGYKEDPLNVYRLLNPLYGMPSAAYAWHTTMNAFLQRKGCETVVFEKSMWKVTIDGHRILLGAQIDNFVLACTNRQSTLFVSVYSIYLIEPMRVYSNTTLYAKLPMTWLQVLHNFLKLITLKKFCVLLDSGKTFQASHQ